MYDDYIWDSGWEEPDDDGWMIQNMEMQEQMYLQKKELGNERVI